MYCYCQSYPPGHGQGYTRRGEMADYAASQGELIGPSNTKTRAVTDGCPTVHSDRSRTQRGRTVPDEHASVDSRAAGISICAKYDKCAAIALYQRAATRNGPDRVCAAELA